MNIGLKIGTKVVTDQNGRTNKEFMLSACQQASKLKKQGHGFFMVSSGAIGSDPNKKRSDNLRACIGQPRLLQEYALMLSIFGIEAGQQVVTDYDLSHPKIIEQVIAETYTDNSLIILNANDGVDNKEIKNVELCADNDSLFEQVCLLQPLNINAAIIAIDQPGLLDAQGKVINFVDQYNYQQALEYAQEGNGLGHRSDNKEECGMKVKVRVCANLSRHNIRTILAPAFAEDFVLRAIARLSGNGEKDFGTVFSLI